MGNNRFRARQTNLGHRLLELAPVFRFVDRFRCGTNQLAALIMSLEAVFAVIGGILVLNERMSSREWVGSALMLTALIIAQLKFVAHKNKTAV